MNSIFTLILAAVFLGACAHHQDVRPGEGVHRVVIKTDDSEEGSRKAIAQAHHFCEEKGKSPVFVTEEKQYTGDLKEQDYKTGKTAAKVATAVGGAAYVFGAKKESNMGGVLGLGGSIANQALGKGYTVEMKFKCQ